MLLYPSSLGGGGPRFGFLGSMKAPSPFPSRGPRGPPPVAPCSPPEPYLGAPPAGARAPAATGPCAPGPGRPGAPCSRRRWRLPGLQLGGPGGWERPGPAPGSPAPPRPPGPPSSPPQTRAPRQDLPLPGVDLPALGPERGSLWLRLTSAPGGGLTDQSNQCPELGPQRTAVDPLPLILTGGH